MPAPLANAVVAPPPQAPAPAQPLAPDPSQAPAASAASDQGQAPAEMPSAIAAVVAGHQPVAVLPPVKPNQSPDPVSEFVIHNFDQLKSMGLQAIEAPDLSTIIFNPSVIPASKVQEAIKSGDLSQLIPAPVEQPSAPDVASQAVEGRATAPVQDAPSAPPMPAPKVPASTQTSLANARVKAIGQQQGKNPIQPNPLSGQLSKRPV